MEKREKVSEQDAGIVVYVRDTLETRAEPIPGRKSIIVNRIFVSGFGRSVTDYHLVTTFRPHGTVLYANIVRTSGPKRYGFVTFAYEEEARLLLKQVREGGLRIYIGPDELQVRPARYAPRRTENFSRLVNKSLAQNIVKYYPMLDAPYYHQSMISGSIMFASFANQHMICNPIAPLPTEYLYQPEEDRPTGTVYFDLPQPYYYLQSPVYPSATEALTIMHNPVPDCEACCHT